MRKLLALVVFAEVLALSSTALASPGDTIWIKRSHGQVNDAPSAVAVSPDGARVYVTGYSVGSTTGPDYATFAYDASTGAKVWTKRYDGKRGHYDYATALAVSPDGTRVYVTGESYGGSPYSDDYATIAYDATSGARIWTRRFSGPGDSFDAASAVAVSPDGTRVYVTGLSVGFSVGDYATIAYDASTGAEVWTKLYDGPGSRSDYATALAVSPDGTKVYVTGASPGPGTNFDYATIAYKASTGIKVWIKRYNGPAAHSYDRASSLAASSDGTTVFVTGGSKGDYATIAYDAVTGAEVWIKRYDGPANTPDAASALAVSPDGTRVYVTGSSTGSTTGSDYTTIAYEAPNSVEREREPWGALARVGL
jgi:DNA-binding beta-propeller fold protein YncE